MNSLGIVIIGRNEGERLRRCLLSLQDNPLGNPPIVYVDSGSTDGSPSLAAKLGAHVVELSADRPFNAARGRNAGLARLLQAAPDLSFVQFVDGDCEISPTWFDHALRHLNENPQVAVLCGHLREKCLDSIYGRLCNMEWKGPIGAISASGGIAMMRIAPVTAVGAFNEAIPAGEEADLCIRLAKAGLTIVRIDQNMGTHDAGMTSFAQWWIRAKRAGRSFTQGALLHGGGAERKHIKAIRSILFWAVVLPLIAFALAWFTYGGSLFLLAAYPLLWVKIRRDRLRKGEPASDASLFATFCILAKFAQTLGVLEYLLGRRQRTLKTGESASSVTLSKSTLSTVSRN